MSALVIDGVRGIYVPMEFALKYEELMDENCLTEECEILSCGPDHPDYWEVWDCVLLELCDRFYQDDEFNVWRVSHE